MSWQHVPVLILVVFFLAALLIALIGRGRPGWAYAIALLATGANAVGSCAALFWVLANGAIHYHLGGWPPPVGIELVYDPLSGFVSTVVSISAFLVLIHSRLVVSRELGERSVPLYTTAMLMLGGFSGMVITGDLFNLYVFLEISSLAGYGLVAQGDPRAPFSAFRYLILGTLGASFYLLGLAFVFMMVGSLNMADVRAILPDVGQTPILMVGMVLMTIGVGLKMGLFPLHGWLPDAYTHASSAATALLAPIGTKVAAYVLIRLFFFVWGIDWVDATWPLTAAVGYLGAAGIIAGSVMAIAQQDLKRMLAYSSVSQVGYIAVGIGLASPLGLIGAVLHILNHACMKACLFLVNGSFVTQLGHAMIPRLDPSVRLAMPWTCAAFAVAALSMIGLPPTAGFFSKLYLAWGSLEQSQWLFLAAILASSLLNAVYFFRVLERIYLGKKEEESGAMDAAGKAGEGPGMPAEVGASMLVPTLILAVGLIVLGLANVWIVESLIRPMIPEGL